MMFKWMLNKGQKNNEDEAFNSTQYWQKRYQQGHNSGGKQYTQATQFKISYLNKLIKQEGIGELIEIGCGDDDVFSQYKIKKAIGLDISKDAVEICKKRFKDDASREFYLVDEYEGRPAELTLSFDVIYHLVEDDIFEDYMKMLFNFSTKFVLIHASNENSEPCKTAKHVKHRHVTDWVHKNIFDFKLIHIEVNQGFLNERSSYPQYVILYEKLV